MTLKHKNYTINLSPISEDEFILKFLIAETKSTRFSQDINLAIKRFNLADTIISQADLNNPQENNDRKRILEGHLRMSVYALNRERLLNPIPIILGVSESFEQWPGF